MAQVTGAPAPANQRPVSRSRDHSWPIRGQATHHGLILLRNKWWSVYHDMSWQSGTMCQPWSGDRYREAGAGQETNQEPGSRSRDHSLPIRGQDEALGLLISDDHLLSGYLDGLSSNKVNHPNNSSESLHKNSTDARIHSKVLVIVDTSSIILSWSPVSFWLSSRDSAWVFAVKSRRPGAGHWNNYAVPDTTQQH